MTRIYTIHPAFTDEYIYADYEGDMTLFNQLFGYALLQEIGAPKRPLTQWTGGFFGNARMKTVEEDPVVAQTRPGAMQIFGVTSENPVANLQPGDPNPFFQFVDSVTKTGNAISRNQNLATLTMVNDDDLRWMDDIGRILLLVAVGGDVEGLEVWYVVPEAAYETDVPTGFLHDTIEELVDPEDPESAITRPRKWSEYKDAFHEHRLVEGFYYIPSNAFDAIPKASQWVPFVIAQQLNVVRTAPTVSIEEPI